MSAITTKSPLDYLREARVRAGFVNRGTASTAVPYSPETIGRHERGDVELEPMDAVVYAESYHDPALMYRFCSRCPVGQRIGRTATDRPLPFATLRIRRLIADAQDVANRLEQMAFDGQIDASEREDFENALTFLRQLEESIIDILLIGLGNKSAAPGATEDGKRGNN